MSTLDELERSHRDRRRAYRIVDRRASAATDADPASSSPTARSSPTPTTCAAARSPSRSPTGDRRGARSGGRSGRRPRGHRRRHDGRDAAGLGDAGVGVGRDTRLRCGGDVRWRRQGHVRPRLVDRPLVPRAGWPAHRRQRRAHRAPRARFVRRRAGRRRRPAARPQHEPHRRGLLPGPAGRSGLRARVEALGKGESVERPRLGVAIAPNHVARRLRRSVGLPERAGILVRGVEDGSPAAAAGIEVGDLIVSAGGSAIADADDLYDALGTLKPPFEVVIVRGAEEKTLSVSAAKPQRTPGDA